MIDLAEELDPFSSFKRRTTEFLKAVARTRPASVLALKESPEVARRNRTLPLI